MVRITPSVLQGKVLVPPSKSYAHRGIIAAFLSGAACCVKNISMSEDIRATLNCAKQLGAKYKYSKKTKTVTIEGGGSVSKELMLNCGESGSTLRFFVPIALAMCHRARFTGQGRLMERPLTPYFELFREKNIDYSLKDGVLTLEGSLTAGDYVIDGSVSSQFITGLLFALPLLDGDSQIQIKGSLASKAYVDITLDVLKSFGVEIINKDYSIFIVKGNQKYKPCTYTVEGDYSQGAFWLVAGALGCRVECMGLNPDSLQGDKRIIEIIQSTGARVVTTEGGGIRGVMTSDMHGVTVDADPIPDLVPILAVFLAFCKGTSRIINAGRLRIKESDRLSAITAELKKMGADITQGEDILEIKGCQVLKGGDLSAWNDHRIAMALAIAGCRCEGEVAIKGAKKAVTKSYEDFFEDYKSLGGVVE